MFSVSKAIFFGNFFDELLKNNVKMIELINDRIVKEMFSIL